MVLCLVANKKLRVEWVNLPGKPVCYLNPGDGAYNYVQHKVIHFDSVTNDEHYDEAYLVIDGSTDEDVTTCTVWKRKEGMQFCFNDEEDRKFIHNTHRGIRQYLYTLASINYCQFLDNGK